MQVLKRRSLKGEAAEFSLVEMLKSGAVNNPWMKRFCKLTLEQQMPYFKRANKWVEEKGKEYRQKFVDGMKQGEKNDFKFCLAGSFWGEDQIKNKELIEAQEYLNAWGLEK